MTPKELCLALINVNLEEQVSKIILNDEILNDETSWTPYGSIENNVGTIFNQSSAPVAALTEKIINSIDAILLNECKKRGIEPDGAKAPRTMQNAVEQFFNIKDGDFSEVARERRRDIASNILVVAEGDKKRPCISIVDMGEGQNPKDFEDTFLSLHKTNKIRVPFVQGKYNMGGTGAIPFCGEKHYQLILSRRNPVLLQHSQRDFWGFTLVRYRTARGNDKSGVFEYFTDKGDMFKFVGESLQVLPEGKFFEYGTLVKLYEYKLDSASNITLNLWRDLNRSLFNPALPVILYEARDFKGHSKDKVLLGNKMRLRVDDNESVEETFAIDAVLGKFGMCKIHIVLLRENVSKTEFATQDDAIFFTINGQTHNTLGRSFLKAEKKASLDYLADCLVINIDLSNIPKDVRDHSFMGSRDRMREDEIKKGVEESLAEELRKHEGLRRLNQQRREKAISSNPKDEVFLKKLLGKLVKENSSIAEILGVGIDIPEGRPGETIEAVFEGKIFPTYLKFYKLNSEKFLEKRVPINSYAILKLETDAENHYLDREQESGELIVSPLEVRHSSHLYNGIITLRIIPKSDWVVGEKQRVKIELTRTYESSLTIEFDLLVEPPVQQITNPVTPRKPEKEKSLHLPQPIPVYKNNTEGGERKTWEQMNPPWSGVDICELKSTIINENQKQYDVFINMDADDLYSFLRRKILSPGAQDFVKRLYQTSILLYSLILYNDLSKSNQEELLPLIMKSVSKVCLDLAYSESLIKSVEE